VAPTNRQDWAYFLLTRLFRPQPALCFGCGCLAAFIVTRKNWRADMIKRGFAHYNEQTGKWEWGEQASRRH
jgi:hypothetical protein